jgi:hypothetical protein
MLKYLFIFPWNFLDAFFRPATRCSDARIKDKQLFWGKHSGFVI